SWIDQTNSSRRLLHRANCLLHKSGCYYESSLTITLFPEAKTSLVRRFAFPRPRLDKDLRHNQAGPGSTHLRDQLRARSAAARGIAGARAAKANGKRVAHRLSSRLRRSRFQAGDARANPGWS